MRAVLTILTAVILATAVPAAAEPFWQQGSSSSAKTTSPSKSLMAQPQVGMSSSAPKPHLNGPGPHNGDWLRKYGDLPPAQQEQQLQNDPVFRSLAPEKQKSLINRLQQFNSLTPSKKQQVLSRMETYEHLTPEQQKQADGLYHQYRMLPADQQNQVSQAYKDLRHMTPEQRAQYFNSDGFRNGFNDEQKNLLRSMSELYPNPAK